MPSFRLSGRTTKSAPTIKKLATLNSSDPELLGFAVTLEGEIAAQVKRAACGIGKARIVTSLEGAGLI